MSDLKKTEPITQENLPAALKDGRICQQEASITLGPLETFELSVMLDLRALMTKDESKFAHLVAGTETIVKTLQNVNPLMRHLERQEALIDQLSDQLSRTEAKLDTVMQAMAEGGKVTIKHEVLTGGDEEAAYLANETLEWTLDDLEIGTRAYNALHYAGIKTVGELVQWSAADLLRKVKHLGAISLGEVVKALGKLGLKLASDEAECLAKAAAEAIATPQAEPTEELYDGNVGSQWDPKNPAKGPIKL